MFLKDFHTAHMRQIQITPEQASRFAKEVAGDFNPIHDPDAKRFCVPGDLLFSLVLSKYGLHRRMCFVFAGMVGQGVELVFPETDDAQFTIEDRSGKRYLEVERDGPSSRDPGLLESLAKAYVAFSGQNFPHVLVPLLAEEGVMINPDRPLVIYERMSVDLDRLEFTSPRLSLSDTSVEVNGKRADVRLHFAIHTDQGQVGEGFKKLVVSGLRDYDPDQAENLVHWYEGRKQAYLAG